MMKDIYDAVNVAAQVVLAICAVCATFIFKKLKV